MNISLSDPNSLLDVKQLKNRLEILGKYSKYHFFTTKAFLAVTRERGWEIRFLNVFQILIRKILGWYQETHLRTVAIAWNEYRDFHGNVCPALTKKIAQLWQKKHSTSILKKSPDVWVFGNSSPKEAAIIGVCQLHSDPDEERFTGKIVAENLRNESVVLLEGFDADCSFQPGTLPYLPRNAELHGWEPVGFQTLANFVFEPILTVIKNFESQTALFLQLMENIKLERDWEDRLEAVTEDFMKSVGKIDVRFEAVSANLNENHPSLERLLNDFMDEYKAFALSQRGEGNMGEENASLLLSKFHELSEKCRHSILQNKYKIKWSETQDRFFLSTWDKRQESLVNEIEAHLEQQKHVIVCAGAALFFPKRGSEQSESLNLIKKHKYSLIIQNNESNTNYYRFAELAKEHGRQSEEEK